MPKVLTEHDQSKLWQGTYGQAISLSGARTRTEGEQLSPRFVEALPRRCCRSCEFGSHGRGQAQRLRIGWLRVRDSAQHQLDLWQLLLGGVFLHPQLGFVRSSNGMSPVDESLKRLGIGDEFVESLCRTMSEFGSGILFSTPRNPLNSAQANSWGVIATARLATFSA